MTARVLTAGYWSVLGSLATKALGGIKTVVLARFLGPEDFGLMGLALVCIGSVNKFSYPGTYTALIQKRDLDESCLNAGWWIHSMRGMLLFVLMLAAAGPVAGFYGDPRLAPVLQVVSLTFLLNGFQSIGLVRLNRDLNFKRLTYLNQVANVMSFLVGVTLAWYLQNVWALVAAHLAQWFGVFLMSYLLEPFEPRIAVEGERLKELLNFGGYVFLISLFSLFYVKGADLALPKAVGMASYGYFALAVSLVAMLYQVIEPALSSIALPALSQVQGDPLRVTRAYTKLFRLALLVSVPLFPGLAIFGRDVVFLVLGPKWMPMLSSLVWLAFFQWFHGLSMTLQSLHVALGRVKVHATLRLLQLIVFLAGLLPVVSMWGIAGAAAWLFAVAFAAFLAQLWTTRRFARGVVQPALRSLVGYWPLFVVQVAFAVVVSADSSWADLILRGLLYGLCSAAFVIWKEKEMLVDLLQTLTRRPDPNMVRHAF